MRFLGYTLAALAMNVMLFQLMAALIARHQLAFKPRLIAHRIDFIRMPEAAEPPPPRRVRIPPPPPAPPKRPPAVSSATTDFRTNVRELPLPLPGLKIETPLAPALTLEAPKLPPLLVAGEPGGKGKGMVRMPPPSTGYIWASELEPVVQTPPLYPPSALRRHLQGYVILEFTVTETGAVEAPRVVEARPAGVFERAALRAIRRWRFRPRLRNGRPVAVRVREKLEFRLRKR